MAEEFDGMLCIAMANGKEFDVDICAGDTALRLKERLRGLMVESGETDPAPCAAMKLLHGLDVLHDDWILKDRGVVAGERLSLVISHFPSGKYQFRSRLDNAPAGRNTTARVQASFQPDGTFVIKIYETEITSLIRYIDFDPYAMGERWDHEYIGKASMGEAQELILSVADCPERKGKFCERSDPFADLMGEFPDLDKVRLQLPFEAGRCNDGRAGLKWITLSRAAEDSKPNETCLKIESTFFSLQLDRKSCYVHAVGSTVTE